MVSILYVSKPKEIEHFLELSSSEGIPPGTSITYTASTEDALRIMDSKTRSGKRYELVFLSELEIDQSIMLTREGKRRGLNVVILDGNDPVMKERGIEAGADKVFSRCNEHEQVVRHIARLANYQESQAKKPSSSQTS